MIRTVQDRGRSRGQARTVGSLRRTARMMRRRRGIRCPYCGHDRTPYLHHTCTTEPSQESAE